MTEWMSPPILAQSLYAFQSIVWLTLGLFAYDCCRYLTFDWLIVSGARKRKWAHAPYLFSKLTAWAFFLGVLIIVNTTTKIDCNALFIANEVFMSLSMVSCSILLALRSACVYAGKSRKIITAALSVLLLAVLGTWLQGCGDVIAFWSADAGSSWQDGACIVDHIPLRYAAKQILIVFFDLVVLTLTVTGTLHTGSTSHIGNALIRQGVQYFSATVLVNMIAAALTLSRLNPIISIIGGMPANAVCVMCSTRLFVNLIEESNSQEGGLRYVKDASSSSTRGRFTQVFSKGQESPHMSNLFNTPAPSSPNFDVSPIVHALHYEASSFHSPKLDSRVSAFAHVERDVEAQQLSCSKAEAEESLHQSR